MKLMTSNLHSLIINPGVTLTYVCENGLTPMDKLHVGQILNFGGHLKAENCGAA